MTSQVSAGFVIIIDYLIRSLKDADVVQRQILLAA